MDHHEFENLRSLDTLREIMRQLRTPVTGCPWDLVQDFKSIAPYTIEEAYEVADAIQREDMDDLCEELGDLLLQVVYHAQMADEVSRFALDDVVEAICRKMIRRHPHVFGSAEARSAKVVKGFWENIKQEEKQAKQDASNDGGDNTRTLSDVPLALPALARAAKLQKKAARVGFDWPDIDPVIEKVEEEINELKPEISAGNAEAAREEIGDLLFAVANLARHLDVDPEVALQEANRKFIRRFENVEDRLEERGRSPAQSSLEEMDALWMDVKRSE